MYKIYSLATGLEIASAPTMELATELMDTLGAYFGALEIR